MTMKAILFTSLASTLVAALPVVPLGPPNPTTTPPTNQTNLPAGHPQDLRSAPFSSSCNPNVETGHAGHCIILPRDERPTDNDNDNNSDSDSASPNPIKHLSPDTTSISADEADTLIHDVTNVVLDPDHKQKLEILRPGIQRPGESPQQAQREDDTTQDLAQLMLGFPQDHIRELHVEGQGDKDEAEQGKKEKRGGWRSGECQTQKWTAEWMCWSNTE
jgi:hypothetical protein